MCHVITKSACISFQQFLEIAKSDVPTKLTNKSVKNFVVSRNKTKQFNFVEFSFILMLQVFSGRHGVQWKFLRAAFSILYPIAHVVIVVSLVSFFITAFSFAINCALEMTFEMVTPQGNQSSTRTMYTCCMLVLLCCSVFSVCVICSLFWEIVKVAVVKRTLKVKATKVVIFFIILIISSIYTGCTDHKFAVMSFVSNCVIVSWFVVFALSILGSIGLLAFCYREPSHELYALVLFPMMVAFGIGSIFSPISLGLVKASTGAICFAFFYPFLVACLTLYVCLRGCRRPNGEYFIIRKRFAFLFIVAYLGVLIVTISSRPFCTKNECYFPANNHTVDNAHLVSNQAPRYPICQTTWTSVNLSIADLGYLSYVAYQENWDKESLEKTINGYFFNRKTQWNVLYASKENPRFYHVLETSEQVNVIGIRGAQSTKEWIRYLNLWSEIVSYQVTSMLLPAQQLPQSLVTSFVSAASFLETLLHHNNADFVIGAIESYITEHFINGTFHHVLLTGHSMGGGLAKIIGSRMGFSAVSFASPGEVYIHRKMGFKLGNAQRQTTSVVSRSNTVTWIDRPGGLIQHIDCNASGHVGCHSIVNMYCELKIGCSFNTPVIC